MVTKPYEWASGAALAEHTKRKHKILEEYFAQYIGVRCQIPQQEKFRLAVVDGFAGAGRYACGTAGSPIIFLEGLRRAIDNVNLHRQTQGLNSVSIECLLILNDASAEAVEILKGHCEPLVAEIKASCPRLHVLVSYMNATFEEAYSRIKEVIAAGRYRSVLFNLDQCGHTHVERNTLVDIMRSTSSAEIFYTFAIESLVAFLRKTDPALLATQLRHLGIDRLDLEIPQGAMSKREWLGAAEKLVFEAFKRCSPFASPFSIHNPDGWRYWLIHFANSYRARQVYNDILHANSTAQAHFGRSGLDMLAYDPSHETGALYLFDKADRITARSQLLDDVPRLVTESGDAVSVGEFYEVIYNATPAHKDDIHAAMIESPDLEVITSSGGIRRKGNTIAVDDTLKLKTQRTFFPMFLDARKIGERK